jgi:hypothetical protein
MECLFPVRIDDAAMFIDGGWPEYIRNTQNIGDMRKWRDHNEYQRALDRLVGDLRPECATPTRRAPS